ncbi:MAG: cobalt-precorrin 5A hydrolase, partial [bacterium]
VVAITKHGLEHAREIKRGLPGCEFWVSEKQRPSAPDADGSFAAVKELAASAWGAYDGLIFVVSLGAVVRTIAPFLKSKDEDPAVVVVDDAKRFAISLLSGHIGGANDLTERVAAILGATPVITTASDARASLAVDLLGRELGWTLEDKANVTPASAAVVNERPVALVQECGERTWWTKPTPLPAHIHVFSDMATARAAGSFDAWLVVSDRATEILWGELGDVWDRVVLYRPKTLCLGMGCDAGTDLDEVWGLLTGTFTEGGLSLKSVVALASIDLKANEESLHQLSEKLGLKPVFFTRDQLNAKGIRSPANPVVEKYTGAVGVSEPSAMLAAGSEDLLLPKRKSRRATLAVARRVFA